jgi:HupE / UreJ protein
MLPDAFTRQDGRLSLIARNPVIPLAAMTFCLLLVGLADTASAHGVATGDKGYIQEITGVNLIAFMYLGAKHMVTGYDHLLFLLGVIFFLYRLKDIGIYATLFAIGHSTTMLAGVYFGTSVSSYLIDAIIGLSVVYKALDNLGAYPRWSSASSMASASPRKSRSSSCPATSSCRTCWPSTWGSSLASFSPSEPSSSSWASGAGATASSVMPTQPTSP